MRNFRFRVRTLLWLVAIVEVLSWVVLRVSPWVRTMWTTSADYREMADFVRSNQRIDLRFADQLEEEARLLREQAGPGDGKLLEQADRKMREAAHYRTQMVRYHAELEECYRRGAARPWNPLPRLPEAPKSP